MDYVGVGMVLGAGVESIRFTVSIGNDKKNASTSMTNSDVRLNLKQPYMFH
jgi:hypothetical protein